jgi:hypothetical protein
MKPEIKKKWLAALRGGDFIQGQNSLRSRNGATGQYEYCCLGVLCELAVQDGVIPEPTLEDGDWIYGKREGDQQSWSSLPHSVAAWAGIEFDATTALFGADIKVAELYEGRGDPTLAALNDAVDIAEDGETCIRPYTFERIADIIEEQL